jgi:hypothetical protein
VLKCIIQDLIDIQTNRFRTANDAGANRNLNAAVDVSLVALLPKSYLGHFPNDPALLAEIANVVC